jgi:hypothetical protein
VIRQADARFGAKEQESMRLATRKAQEGNPRRGRRAQNDFPLRVHPLFHDRAVPYVPVGLHWAKIERVLFGARMADAKGFSELCVPAADLTQMGGSPLGVGKRIVARRMCQIDTQWLESGVALIDVA